MLSKPDLGCIRIDIRELCREAGAAEVYLGIVGVLIEEFKRTYPQSMDSRDAVKAMLTAESWCKRLVETQQGRAGK